MLSRKPRSWAKLGRGIWAGLVLTPILVALAALLMASIGGGASATAGNSAAKAASRVRPIHLNTGAGSHSALRYWTPARRAAAESRFASSQRGDTPADGAVPGPHTSYNYFPKYNRVPVYRSAKIYYTQGGVDHAASGSVTNGAGNTMGVAPFTNASRSTCSGSADACPRNVIWTAGSVVHDGVSGEAGWSTNLIVCLIYDGTLPSRNMPLGGCWDWVSESTTSEWMADAAQSRNYGVVFTTSCRDATAPVGSFGDCIAGVNPGDRADLPPGTPPNYRGHGLAWCQTAVVLPGCPTATRNRDQNWVVLGWPASNPPLQTGRSLRETNSEHRTDRFTDTGGPDSNSFGSDQRVPSPNGVCDTTKNNDTCGSAAGAAVLLRFSGIGGNNPNSLLNSNVSRDDPLAAVGTELLGPFYDGITCFDWQFWTGNTSNDCSLPYP